MMKKPKKLFYLVALLVLVCGTAFAAKERDETNPLQEGFSNFEPYAAIDDKAVDVASSEPDEVAVKDPDNELPYLEVGLRKRY